MKANDFLAQDKFKDADLIHVNWKLYGDNDLVYYEPRPVIERFTKPAPIDIIYSTKVIGKDHYYNQHVKSIVRVNDKTFKFNTPHTVVYNTECKCVNVNGEIEDSKCPIQNICYNGGHLKHFITKSTEEFIERKLHNNSLASSDSINSIFEDEVIAYFNINAKTYSKCKLIEEKTNKKV